MSPPRNDGDLLLVSGGSTTRAVRIALGSMRRPGVAHVELAGPPSHRYLLGYALRHLPPEGYGYADAVLTAVAAASTTRVLLSSVARLERPTPGLGYHLASWLPGTSFTVDLGSGRVQRLRDNTFTLPVGPFGVIAERWPANRQVVVDPLPPALVTVRGPDDAAPWRAARWLETTVVSRPVADLVQYVLSEASARPCPSCGRFVVGPRCRFCSVPVTESGLSDHPARILEKEHTR